MKLYEAFLEAANAAKDAKLCKDSAILLGTMGLGDNACTLNKIDWLQPGEIIAYVTINGSDYKIVLTPDNASST